ncbi:hypothetical protein PoB_000233600 [Plakobranchus ocellatus]|uniref:Uncharacterized protein n=1 Tax=Plakobranchus ocellatus TaxID=259542 RepID=A0AAV3X977_9GAST|nr:hypothetical protein PoB_000233600 [Plakobranchus ocellatus]
MHSSVEGSGGSSGRAVGYQARGQGFESQPGPNQIIIAPPCPPSTKWPFHWLQATALGNTPFRLSLVQAIISSVCRRKARTEEATERFFRVQDEFAMFWATKSLNKNE